MQELNASTVRVATDVGGTFTDSAVLDEHGHVSFEKAPSTPADYSQGIVDCLGRHDFTAEEISSMVHGSTVVINAVIQRKGAKTAFLTTDGFRDLLLIQRHNRPQIRNIRYRKPVPLVERALQLSVVERMTCDGTVLRDLDEDGVRAVGATLRDAGVEAVAVCFLHAYANPAHEERARELLREEHPQLEVVLSSEVMREYREFERASSTVVNAFTRPVVSRYLDSLERALELRGAQGELYVMNSSGGVMSPDQARWNPLQMMESGPAGGIMGAVELGRLIGIDDLVAFDMGGTTVKASLVRGGEPAVLREYEVPGHHPLMMSVLDIVELGAGGGSIAWVADDGTLKVGPRSAGSHPGPVCYQWGGREPTLTDANVVLGRFNPANFWGGELQLDVEAAEAAIKSHIGDPLGLDVTAAAAGISEIAIASIRTAVRIVSVERGHDTSDFTLVAYGGSGPMFASRIARELGLRGVVIPFAAANFSAWGMLTADLRYDRSQTLVRPTDQVDAGQLVKQFELLERELDALLEHDGVPPEARSFARQLSMRYAGQEHTLEVPVADEPERGALDEVVARFHELHEIAFKQSVPGEATEITRVGVTAIGAMAKPQVRPLELTSGTAADALVGNREVLLEREFELLPVYDRSRLAVGAVVEGPAVVEEPTCTTLLQAEDHAVADRYGNLLIADADVLPALADRANATEAAHA
ncbi:MAG: hydantoinase/oxoprolinase family protein [Actinobacteria bacterium]|nr:hydantoinase/oxoprolinase family protein [Actinomycetota bacterium]